jgi:uncharacterized protein YndB with AHSA1/START domain
MATIYHQVWINAPVAKVYEALSTAEGISNWWDKQTAVETATGQVLEHNPGPMHGVVKLKVLELVPDKHIEWECISTHPKTSPGSAWTGTHIRFDLYERGNVAGLSGFGQDGDRISVLDFRQIGYDEHSEYFGYNNFAWGCVLQELKKWCESRYRRS